MAKIDDLMADLNQLKTDQTNTIQQLTTELAAAQAAASTNQPVDLSGAIALVDSLRSSLGDSGTVQTPQPTPTPST